MIQACIPYVFVFGATFALDYVWAYYTKALNERAATRAAWWAAGIMILGGVAQFGYVNDPVLLIPAALGAAAGTYVAVRRHAR